MTTTLVLLHVLFASVWTGGHLVLTLGFLPRALALRDPEPVRAFEARFEPLAVPSLLGLVVTGVWLALRMQPRMAAWIGFADPVAFHLTLKLALLLATLALAVHARFTLGDKLTAERLGAFAGHAIAVTVFAVLLLVLGVSLRSGGW